jgi:hypothetical protein
MAAARSVHIPMFVKGCFNTFSAGTNQTIVPLLDGHGGTCKRHSELRALTYHYDYQTRPQTFASSRGKRCLAHMNNHHMFSSTH